MQHIAIETAAAVATTPVPENSDPTAQAEALIAKTTNKVGEESMDGKA